MKSGWPEANPTKGSSVRYKGLTPAKRRTVSETKKKTATEAAARAKLIACLRPEPVFRLNPAQNIEALKVCDPALKK